MSYTDRLDRMVAAIYAWHPDGGTYDSDDHATVVGEAARLLAAIDAHCAEREAEPAPPSQQAREDAEFLRRLTQARMDESEFNENRDALDFIASRIERGYASASEAEGGGE